jgi:hypothetical protein
VKPALNIGFVLVQSFTLVYCRFCNSLLDEAPFFTGGPAHILPGIDDVSHAAAHRRPKPHQVPSGPKAAASPGTVMSKLLPFVAISTIAVASAFATAQAHAADAAQPVAAPTPVTHESAPVFNDQASTLSRAEVLADLQVWQASGLAQLQHGDAPDVYGAEYQRASALYAALRKSPHFAVLVQSIAAKRGEVVAGSAFDATRAVQ